ncbi:MAG: 4-hydroxy-3-methylbut-2-enyl diphosphate reductase, partial [Methylobacillus glycogenes]|nr:4-hydroxy-3-methylbut-2-enyl diphosphate reductase [Methylobacillus glycogenes]
TQTTLSVDDATVVIDALKKRFPNITGPKKDDICYATQNRQDAVKVLAENCDLVIVVGSTNSSNSRRLKEVSLARGVEAYLVDGPDEIEIDWFKNKNTVGVTAGASAPEVLVQRVVSKVQSISLANVRQLDVVIEDVSFPLPRELTN